jgi:hypothetical protein
MTTSAPSHSALHSDLATLDRRIERALNSLRLTRAVSARLATRSNLAAEKRAEANLNALLEYRHAVGHRQGRG